MKKIILVTMIIMGSLGYFIVAQYKGDNIGHFLNKTTEMVESNDLDRGILDRFSEVEIVPISPLLKSFYDLYLGMAVYEFKNKFGSQFKGIAVNEPYDPDENAVFIYILDEKMKDWVDKLNLKCNAVSDTVRKVILIDIRLITSFATSRNCDEAYQNMFTWTEDKSSTIGSAVKWNTPDSVDEFLKTPNKVAKYFDSSFIATDYLSRQLSPLFIIGHELGHQFLHSGEKAALDYHISSDFEATSMIGIESEADQFAIDTLIRSLYPKPIFDIDKMLTNENEYMRIVAKMSIMISERVRQYSIRTSDPKIEHIVADLAFHDGKGAILSSLPDVFDFDKDLTCTKNLGLVYRLNDMIARVNFYSWQFLKNNDVSDRSSMVPNTLYYDDYYQKVRDQVAKKITECKN